VITRSLGFVTFDETEPSTISVCLHSCICLVVVSAQPVGPDYSTDNE